MKNLSIIAFALFLASCGAQTESNSTEEITKDTMNTEQVEPEIVGEEISYQGDGITMKGYMAYNANAEEGSLPGVIIVHEWWGHNEHSRNSAKKLAEAGYVAFALDMYGDGKQAEHPDDAGAFAGAVMKNFDSAKERFNAAAETLKSYYLCDAERIAAIGYCFGGGVVLNMARQGADLDAVATFHGSIGPIEPAIPGSVKGKILVMNGADDPFVSPEAIDAFKSEMDSAGVDYEFVNYPGAIHAFTNPKATENGEKFDLPLAYNEQVDKESWAKLLTFLESTFN